MKVGYLELVYLWTYKGTYDPMPYMCVYRETRNGNVDWMALGVHLKFEY